MKSFYSIFSILLSILCLLALFFYPQQDSYLFHDFSTKVLAREIVPDIHNTFSDAHLVSPDQTYQVKLSAHNSFYGYTSFNKKTHFTITSNAIKNLKISLFTDTGKKLPCRLTFLKRTCTVSPTKNSFSRLTRIFLCITNQSSANCSLFIRTEQAAEKRNQIKIKNRTTQKPRQNNTTSNPKQNPSTAQIKKPILYPQFLVLTPASKYKLVIKRSRQNCRLSDFTVLSSNPSIASVKNGKVSAHKEGTTILYICDKKNSAMTSSCFLRILDTAYFK